MARSLKQFAILSVLFTSVGFITWLKVLNFENDDGDYRFIRRPVHSGDGTDPLLKLDPMLDALDIMQDHFFTREIGTWNDANDWTSAVMGTHVAMTMGTVTSTGLNTSSGLDDTENTVNRYFSHLIQFYHGQNWISLRLQAFDDMLWVVLQWLETLKLMNTHAQLHWKQSDEAKDHRKSKGEWYGEQYAAIFAHRARTFYDLASNGWDTRLCGGGMNWSPYLRPYKNAITNQLFISASIGMYMYFPGDDNDSPYVQGENVTTVSTKPHDPKFLHAAIDAYKWLSTSNMTNSQGLYVDGFHVGNESAKHPKCNVRNEMVYTYNQGVVLSGLRGLWEATGEADYLDDGYKLIESTINATGWHGYSQEKKKTGRWAGLGRDGYLEEVCDAFGDCSQNGQAFKGIFFWHMASFCAPLPVKEWLPGKTFTAKPALRKRHEEKCRGYTAWVAHNARGAYRTKSKRGEFGMWWHPRSWNGSHLSSEDVQSTMPPGAVDYRNGNVPKSARWMYDMHAQNASEQEVESTKKKNRLDLNDRGRGRTVETQATGLAVIKAFWELVNFRDSRFGKRLEL